MSKEGKILIAVLVVIVGGMIGLFALFNNGESTNTGANSSAPKPEALVRDTSYTEGTGPVSVVEFGDYQCPACGSAYPILKQLEANNQGKVSFTFRNYPLPTIHKNAVAAANAAEEAGAQGKYFEMHSKLYETQNEWSNLSADAAAAKFGEYATSLGLDSSKVIAAVKNQTYRSRIDADVADGDAQNVQSTPTIYIDGKLMQARDLATLQAAVDAAQSK